MADIKYTKNGRPWQEVLQIGDRVEIEHWQDATISRPSTMSTTISTITFVSDNIVKTEGGEIFDRKTLEAIDFASPGEDLVLTPDLRDPMISIVTPTIEELMTEMSREEAIEWLRMWNDAY